MGMLSLEHGKLAYDADFIVYGIAVVFLMLLLMLAGPREQRPGMAALVLLGLAAWSLIEYLLHRFVLHGLQPFQRWHVAHHQRPKALICTPTIVSATLILGLVFLPALLVSGLWPACALTLGILCGYLAYSTAHHAVHHWHTDNTWLKQRKRYHALHHHKIDQPGYYGVTSNFWDHVFGSGRPKSGTAD